MRGFFKTLLVIQLVGCFVSISNGQLMCFHCEDCDTSLVEIVQCGPNRPLLPFPGDSTTTVPPPPPTTTTTPSNPSTTTADPETTTVTPPTLPTIEPETTTPYPPSVTTNAPETTTVTVTTPTVEPETTTLLPPTVEPDTTTITPTPTVEPDTTTITTPGGPILTPPTHPTFSPGPPASSSTPSSPILTPPTHPTPLPAAPIGFGIAIPIPPNNTQYACLSVQRTDVNNRSVITKGCARLMASVPQTCSQATNGGHSSCSVCLGSLCNAYN